MGTMQYRLRENEDGTLTLDIPRGICYTDAVFTEIETNGWTRFAIPRELGQLLEEDRWKVYDRISAVTIPSSLAVVQDLLFWRLRNLKELHIHPDNPYLLMEDGALYSKNKKVIYRCFEKEGRHTFRIGEGVEEIGESCFWRVKGLARIDIGKNVKKICNYGLWGDSCDFLERIYIPPTVTELSGEIFDSGGDSAGVYYPVSVVGGASGSAIEEYCNVRGIPFFAVEEDGIEDFYVMPLPELYARIKEITEKEKVFLVTDPENGYQAKITDGVLEFRGFSATGATLKDTRVKINADRREKVKKAIIGSGIREIADLALDDYENLESVYIGADVQVISPLAFSGRNQSGSGGCRRISSFVVDENNPYYRAIDDVLYTRDMQTLVKYSPGKPELYHEVDPRVRHIGDFAFEYTNALLCVKVGGNCISVGHAAFLNVQNLRHAWFAGSVTTWPEHYPFVGEFGFDWPWRIRGLVIGGPGGSVIEKYCAAEGVHFFPLAESQTRDFLKTPVPDEEEDPYRAACLKKLLVDRNGTVCQLGEYGEELILPEGVTETRYRIDLSGCKKVVLPSTIKHLWTEGFDGPAKNLKAFSVAEGNEAYRSIKGHLYGTDGTLLTYAPAADDHGVLPEETLAIDESAFRLLPNPLEKVYIPAGTTHIDIGWHPWFCEVKVAKDNPCFKAVDGSLFSTDGKVLVCAKVSPEGYHVPAGTEVIAKGALYNVHGVVHIPASVTKIEDSWGLGRQVTAIAALKDSFAETYAKKYTIPLTH